VTLFNGRGKEFPAHVESVARRRVIVIINAVYHRRTELPFDLEVAVSLPKGDRVDFLVEKLTELGVARLVPLQTARSVVLPRDTKLERMQRHVVEACKQCGRNVLMKVDPLTAWDGYCTQADRNALRILAHPAGSALDQLSHHKGHAVLAAVGPEGGFTEDEVNLAVESGWAAVDLGPRILRVETVAVALAAIMGVGGKG
jgi:16S rRNA (uracil1498-N3)-methyltransferase